MRGLIRGRPTRAEFDADSQEWRITGQKVWTSLAHESDYVFVLARTDPEDKGHRGLGFFLLPMAQPGITIRPIKQLTGTAEFNEVFLMGPCSAEDIVGQPGDGWRVAMGLLGFERGVSTLGQQMLFQTELDEIVRIAREMEPPGTRCCASASPRPISACAPCATTACACCRGETMAALSREAMIYKLCWSSWHRNLGKLAMDVLGPEAELLDAGPTNSIDCNRCFCSPGPIRSTAERIRFSATLSQSVPWACRKSPGGKN